MFHAPFGRDAAEKFISSAGSPRSKKWQLAVLENGAFKSKLELPGSQHHSVR